MSRHPTFSVIVPLFNKGPYILRAVSSVLAQEDGDFELLVIDDGSTDGGAQQLAEISDQRISVIAQSNAGVSAARNVGLTRARGDWVAFLDADDAWFPRHLRELRKVGDTFPGAGMIATAYAEVSGADFSDRDLRDQGNVRTVDYFQEAARRVGFLHTSSVAIRHEVAQRLGGFREFRAGEDLEYWARVALDYDVAVSDLVTSVYFRDTGGVMEQLARSPAARENANPVLSDVSPSAAMLCSRAAADPNVLKRSGVRRYLNSRVESSIKMSLYRGQYRAARGYSALLIGPISPMQALYRVLTALPLDMQSALMHLYRELAPRLRGAGPGTS